jgi:acyl carrier protein
MSTTSSSHAGRTEATPEQVATIIEEILGTEEIAADESFFEMGGNSMRALTLISRVKERWAAKITLINVIQNPTPTLLAALIEKRAPDSTATSPGEPGR